MHAGRSLIPVAKRVLPGGELGRPTRVGRESRRKRISDSDSQDQMPWCDRGMREACPGKGSGSGLSRRRGDVPKGQKVERLPNRRPICERGQYYWAVSGAQLRQEQSWSTRRVDRHRSVGTRRYTSPDAVADVVCDTGDLGSAGDSSAQGGQDVVSSRVQRVLTWILVA